MTIKVGDYVESLHGNVGVVKTVGKTVTVDGKEQFSFDWEITRPSIKSGDRGFFAGNESDLWLHYWGILQPPYGENLCGSIYRGLTSTIRYDVDDNLYIGKIVGIKDTVAFHGRTLNECLHSSEKAVDKYLKMILEER